MAETELTKLQRQRVEAFKLAQSASTRITSKATLYLVLELTEYLLGGLPNVTPRYVIGMDPSNPSTPWDIGGGAIFVTDNPNMTAEQAEAEAKYEKRRQDVAGRPRLTGDDDKLPPGFSLMPPDKHWAAATKGVRYQDKSTTDPNFTQYFTPGRRRLFYDLTVWEVAP